MYLQIFNNNQIFIKIQSHIAIAIATDNELVHTHEHTDFSGYAYNLWLSERKPA